MQCCVDTGHAHSRWSSALPCAFDDNGVRGQVDALSQRARRAKCARVGGQCGKKHVPETKSKRRSRVCASVPEHQQIVREEQLL